MKALVIGLGISGRGAVQLLLKEGYEVHAVDRQPQEITGVAVHPEGVSIEADLVVLSPGIPRSHPLARGTAIGEAELGMRFLNNRMIGVTGTNGKTTMVLLITHVLQSAGKKARSLGNVGKSIAEYACHPDPEEILVVELSSFQLETLEARKLDVGIITTISPDHLERYSYFDAHRDTKYRIKTCVKEGGTFFSEGDSYLQVTDNHGYWDRIGLEVAGKAYLACKEFGISLEAFNQALATFKRPPHRMEQVDTIQGVTYINDSKGTNIDSVVYGVNQVNRPLFLIAGGRGKGETFEKWKTLFPQKVRRVFAIGETAGQIQQELEGVVPVERCFSMDEAIEKASQQAKEGDVVLLSPGCASFDQFKNYEERGDRFKASVKKLGSRYES